MGSTLLTNGLGSPPKLLTRGLALASIPVAEMRGTLLTEGLGRQQKIITRGYRGGGAAGGPIRSTLISRGLGIDHRLFTRGLSPTTPASPAPSLSAAIFNHFKANDETLSEITGFYANESDKKAVIPYAVVELPNEQVILYTSTKRVYLVQVCITVVAASLADARRLADLIEIAFHNVVFTYAKGMTLSGHGESHIRSPEEGEVLNGQRVWRDRFAFSIRDIRTR